MKLHIIAIGQSTEYTYEGPGQKKIWYPSNLIIETQHQDPGEKWVIRTHRATPDLDPDSPNAYLGGGKIVVRALANLLEKRADAHATIIGGTPPSMGITDVTEAVVMRDYLREQYGATATPVTDTKTTEEAMQKLLELAHADQAHDLTFVLTMGFRIRRCALHMHALERKFPKYAGATSRIFFLDAVAQLPEDDELYAGIETTKAYKRTITQEMLGIEKMRRQEQERLAEETAHQKLA